jgi:hypothetical protein
MPGEIHSNPARGCNEAVNRKVRRMSAQRLELNGIRVYAVPAQGPELRTGGDAVDRMSAASFSIDKHGRSCGYCALRM